MDVQKAIDNLTKKGFKTRYFATGAEAAAAVAAELHGVTVGIGGSKTVEALGLYETLGRDNEVFWHWKQPMEEARAKAAAAAVYLCSANAIAETGQIVNIDGNGNRVAATSYGHEKLYILAGVNKLTPDLEAALWRAENVAGPLNVRRFGTDLPIASRKDGGAEVSVTVRKSAQFFGWVAGMNGAVTIAGPKALAAEYRSWLQDLASQA